jgi:tetratricopeptide (TPR) repeat protein
MQSQKLIKILLLISFAWLLFLPVTGHSREEFDPDSLERVIAETTDVDKKIDILIEITQYYIYKDVNTAQSFAEQLMEVSLKEDHKKGLSYAYFFLANVLGEFDYAMVEDYVLKSMEIAKERDDQVLEARLYNTIGGLKHNAGLYDEEIEYYFKAIDLYEASGSDSLIAGIYNNLGIVYSIKGDPELANEYFRQAAELNTRFSNWPWLSINLLNIGYEYLEAGDTENALEYLQRSMDIANKYDYQRLYAWICNNLGLTYAKMGEKNRAKEYFLLGLENAKKMNNREQEIMSLTHLKDLYETEGDFENAYRFLVDIKRKNDSLQNMQSIGTIDRLETAFIYQKKLEQEALRHQNQTLVYWMVIIALLFLIGVIVALYYYQRLRAIKDQAVREKLQAEKDYLQKEVGIKSRELIS